MVLSGISGSGKSTLAFDLLHKESQRQYMEALGMVTFGRSKPPVLSISGLSPSVSMDQRQTNHSPRSTVGTSTDVYTYLRVLFARLGRRLCQQCKQEIPPNADLGDEDWQGEGEAAGDLDGLDAEGRTFPCPHCGAPAPEMDMAYFSFNKPAGACPTCTGLGYVQQVNLARLVDEDLSFAAGGVTFWDDWHTEYHRKNLQMAGQHFGFEFDPDKPLREYNQVERDLLFYGVESPRFRRHFPASSPLTQSAKGASKAWQPT